MMWDIKYIYEGFLVWLIPSTYLSHEAVNWACTTDFSCIWFYSVLSVLSILWCFLNLGDNSGYMNSGYGDIRYRLYTWRFSCLDYSFDVLISQIGILGLYNWFCHIYFTWCLTACSCVSCSWHDFQYMLFDSDLSITCACPCMTLGTHLTTRCEVSDSLRLACLDLGVDLGGLLIDQSCVAIASWISGRPVWGLSFQAPVCLTSFCNSWSLLYCS